MSNSKYFKLSSTGDGFYSMLLYFNRIFLNAASLVEHTYEIDHENDGKNDLNNSKSVKFKRQAPKHVEKQGWLHYKLTTPNDIYPNKVVIVLTAIFF